MTLKKKTKLKVGDLVEIIAGKDKGKSGKLVRLFLKSGRGVVEGLNLAKRHVKPSAKNAQGEILTKEAALHLSNLKAIDPLD